MVNMIRLLAEQISRKFVFKRRLPGRFGGASLFVSTEGGLRYCRPSIEKVDPYLINIALEVLRPGDTVWDIGANVGLFTFAAAGLVGPEGRVLSVEPDSWLINLLRRSVQLNRGRCARVDLLPVAVSNSVGISELFIAKRSRASNHLQGAGLSQAGGCREKQLVPTTPLDSILGSYPAPRVLKIDVEGMEVCVLQGATRILREARPIVICEVSEENADAVTHILIEAGYKLFDADLPGPARPSLGRASWNTLAVPRSRHVMTA
jgi:FkbM family methyltransferase